jgi:hypothetical protein
MADAAISGANNSADPENSGLFVHRFVAFPGCSRSRVRRAVQRGAPMTQRHGADRITGIRLAWYGVVDAFVPVVDELVWTATMHGNVIDARIRNCGQYGVQLQLFWNGAMYFSEMHATRRHALRAAVHLRHEASEGSPGAAGAGTSNRTPHRAS